MINAYILNGNGNAIQGPLAFSSEGIVELDVITGTDNYYIQVTGSLSGVNLFHLTAYDVAPTPDRLLFKVTDIIRSNIFKYFYLNSEASNNTLTVTVSPSGSSSVFLYSTNPTNQFAFNAAYALTPSSTVGGVDTYIVNGLANGYYGLRLNNNITVSITVSYLTYNYACPYNSEFNDKHGVFAGCLHSTDNSNLPCLELDGSSYCKRCMGGYVAINGVCILVIRC